MDFNYLKNYYLEHDSIFKFRYHYVFLTLLLIQNLIIFSPHYFNDAGFPWDFNLISYGFPAFLTTAWSLGIFPEWMPFQSMGYPIVLMPIDVFYPFFWIHAIFGIQYTMHVAVVTQTIHFLIGSFGMYFLLQTILKSPKYAFIGAFAFAFFGGFYSNAQHDVIIRAFVLGPWIFYVFYFGIKNKISRRILFIPIVIFLLATGAYFGNFIASLFIIGFFVISQLIYKYYNGFRTKKLIYLSFFLLLLVTLGIAISAIAIGPPFQYLDNFARDDFLKNIKSTGLSFESLSSLFLSNKLVTGVSVVMSGTFITLPVLILASFLPISILKKYFVFFIPLLISFLMVLGPNSPFWEFITSTFSVLKLSRFPSSDYRIFLVIPIIIFGILSLKNIAEQNLTWKFLFIRSMFVSLWFIPGIFSMYYGIIDAQVLFAIFILFLTIISIIYSTKIRKTKSINSNIIQPKKNLLLVIFILLISVSGAIVISDIPTWNVPFITTFYSEKYIPLVKNEHLIVSEIFDNLPSERPERESVPNKSQFSWKGYLTGKYMMEDSIKGAALTPKLIVESDEIYTQFMLKRWTPILVDPENIQFNDNDGVSLPKQIFVELDPSHRSYIQQTYYGIDDITYHVSLEQSMMLIENEMYFPGWQAILVYPDREDKIEALVTNDVFRSWLLPAGEYEMKASFELPNMFLFKIISIVSFVIWFLIVVYFIMKSHFKKMLN